MPKYKPNFISLRARLLLATGAAFLLVIALAQLATGYTFMPSKHKGIFLSGIPTLMAVVATLALCLALVLTVIDHYDKRNNEEIYNSLQTRSFLTFIIMDEPAKFNAVLLTHIAGGLFMFSISILGIIGVVTNRIK